MAPFLTPVLRCRSELDMISFSRAAVAAEIVDEISRLFGVGATMLESRQQARMCEELASESTQTVDSYHEEIDSVGKPEYKKLLVK
jgi:hypothetical protein